jgi:hypothetical protein
VRPAASVGKSRAAVLSQAGAPLSWTSERACERVRKAAANERQPQRAERAMHSSERRRSSSASDDEVGGFHARLREQLQTNGTLVL